MKKLLSLSMALVGLCFLGSCSKEEENVVEKGSVVFWSDQDAGCGPISIMMGDAVVGTLSNYSSNGVAPDCGELGYVTLDLDPGSYSYNASDQCGTWSGLITVNEGSCLSYLLDYK